MKVALQIDSTLVMMHYHHHEIDVGMVEMAQLQSVCVLVLLADWTLSVDHLPPRVGLSES